MITSIGQLLGTERYTLEEVADMMNLTRERVRQIERAALNKFKRKLGARGIHCLGDICGDAYLADANDSKFHPPRRA